uniref:Transmembrane protein 123 n=1 Tax=Serinus canaria TaxID=9135 RepID=A0A8C9MKI8_SERCA
MINVVLLNEYTVVYFDEFFCVVSQKFPGVSSSTTHVTSTSHPNTTTTMSVILTTQPTKTSQTATPTTASPVTLPQATSKSEAVIVKTSRFDVGSFVGGIVLTLGVLVILYIGCKTYHSRRGIQYRTIDEHDAII